MHLTEIIENKKKERVKVFHVQENFERARVIHSNHFFFPSRNYPGNYVISLLCLPVETKRVGLVRQVRD